MTTAQLTRRARKPCSSPSCGRVVETYAYVQQPRCRPCRRRMRSLLKARMAQADKRLDLKVAFLMAEIAENLEPARAA